MKTTHPDICTLRRNIALLFLIGIPLLAACGDDAPMEPVNNGPTETSNTIVYGRHRDVTTGNVVPVLAESGGGFDARSVDSPSVAIDAIRPAGDKFLLYYEAENATGTNTIGLVTSDEEDFEVLTVARSQVIGQGPALSGYEAGATDPTVVVDKRPAETTRRYKMWFEGRGGTGGAVSTIMFAVSADGVTWTNIVPCNGLNPTFASVRVADPSVVLDGDTLRMWFEGIATTTATGDGAGRIGYAQSTDGINWTVMDAGLTMGPTAAPVFASGAPGGFDGYSVNAPAVVLDPAVGPGVNGRFRMWYEAGDKAGDVQNTIGYATSADGRTWNRETLPILVPSSDLTTPLPFDSGDLEHPSAAIIASIASNVEGHFLLWYTGDGEGGASPNRIGLAKGRTGP